MFTDQGGGHFHWVKQSAANCGGTTYVRADPNGDTISDADPTG